RPLSRAHTLYVLLPAVSPAELDRVRRYLINPVERREAAMDKPETLVQTYDIPTSVATVEGFIGMDREALAELLKRLGLAMDLDDLAFLQSYFQNEERRDPTITEIRVVDTYWSDHCRHTTFGTHLDSADIQDPAVKAAYDRYKADRVEVYGQEKAAKRPETLMDIATAGTKVLKKRGGLANIDQSEEINACS
ncbi:MAG: phosphoribosylformylglycinamidine synthase, partial [Clostridiales bacterium]|nr:phosphoribosylformylglycinamidine synthase [Clostridiales bacterium]